MLVMDHYKPKTRVWTSRTGVHHRLTAHHFEGVLLRKKISTFYSWNLTRKRMYIFCSFVLVCLWNCVTTNWVVLAQFCANKLLACADTTPPHCTSDWFEMQKWNCIFRQNKTRQFYIFADIAWCNFCSSDKPRYGLYTALIVHPQLIFCESGKKIAIKLHMS